MSEGNQSALMAVTEFFIVGFPGLHPAYFNLLGAFFFVIYVLAVFENSVLVVSFTSAPTLQKPLYITMLSLALCDIGFCTVALPKVISRYWFNNGSISFSVCLLQRQLIHYFGTLNSLIMMVMALDRYMAICFPLRYPVLMTNRTMALISGLSWVSAMIAPSISTIQTAQMFFCGPSLIIHCYCDGISMFSLACGDITMQRYISTTVASIVLLLPFGFIIFSYISIGVSVIRTTNNQGRIKAFSTCATQLSIICIYYIPRIFVYLTPYLPNLKMNSDERIALTMFYGLFPPLVNPLIYYFRTKEIHTLMHKWCAQKNVKSHNMNIVSILK